MYPSYLCIIQARLGSTRFPNKVLQTVGGIPMVKRVWLAAKSSWVDKVVVAWPERYPRLDENDVLTRFQRIAREFPHTYIVRLTADCPLITSADINQAIKLHHNGLKAGEAYYNNRKDGRDVQIFPLDYLWSDYADKEHVIKDLPNTGGCSVNTKYDLERARHLCETK
jgi:glutamate-1-semialdehyde 2,1-aminomutase